MAANFDKSHGGDALNIGFGLVMIIYITIIVLSL